MWERKRNFRKDRLAVPVLTLLPAPSLLNSSGVSEINVS